MTNLLNLLSPPFYFLNSMDSYMDSSSVKSMYRDKLHNCIYL